MRERLLRQRSFTSQPPPRKLCVDDESLDSLGWCAMVPPLFWVPRIRVVKSLGCLNKSGSKSISYESGVTGNLFIVCKLNSNTLYFSSYRILGNYCFRAALSNFIIIVHYRQKMVTRSPKQR